MAKKDPSVPKSVSCEPLFLRAATRRAEELGYRLSAYVRCLIAHDLQHHIIAPDALVRFQTGAVLETRETRALKDRSKGPKNRRIREPAARVLFDNKG
jgi:hypothetical protein